MSRVKEALTRKLGPLPAWAWLSISGVGLYLWRRHQAAAGAGTTAQPTDSSLTGSSTDTGSQSGSGFGGGDGGGSSGGGGMGAGGVGNQPPDTAPPTMQPPADQSPPVPDQSPPPDSGAGGDSSSSAPPPSTRVPKLSQPASQKFLVWGGQTFTTQAAFEAWAKQHGTSVAAIFKTHPEAAAIYGNLGKTSAKAPNIFLPRRGGSGTPKPAPPHTTPVSVRSTPPRPTIRTAHEPPKRVTPPRTRSSSRTIAAGAVRGGGSPSAPRGPVHHPIVAQGPPKPKPRTPARGYAR